jgi:hypothetical protein
LQFKEEMHMTDIIVERRPMVLGTYCKNGIKEIKGEPHE